MNDHKTFLKKWEYFWVWFDAITIVELSIAAGILMFSVSGCLAMLRLVGLI